MIPRESSLLVANEATFREQFAIDVRTHCEAIRISRQNKTVDLRNVLTGQVTSESYDKLVLSPGAKAIRPPMPGIDLLGVFKVRTVTDVKEIKEQLEGHDPHSTGLDTYTGFQTIVPARRAVVVGGGFIGLEMAENLKHLGLQATLVQRDDQVMPPLDPEMSRYFDGFEGDTVNDPESVYHGKRMKNGRKNSAPWTYALDPAKVWIPTGVELEKLRSTLDV